MISPPCKCHIMHSAILKLFKNANPVRNPKFFVSTTIREKNFGNNVCILNYNYV